MSNNQEFIYRLLSRLQSDCEYYLGHGGRSPRNLWALNEKEQIENMKDLWNQLEEKPEWLTYEQILEYESKMITDKN